MLQPKPSYTAPKLPATTGFVERLPFAGQDRSDILAFKLAQITKRHSHVNHRANNIFNMALNLAEGRRRLEKWAAKVERSALNCFDKFLKTLRNHLDTIANYFHRRANSGFVEGFNNKLKTVTRRSYGLNLVDSLFRRLWLDLNGYKHFIA